MKITIKRIYLEDHWTGRGPVKVIDHIPTIQIKRKTIQAYLDPVLKFIQKNNISIVIHVPYSNKYTVKYNNLWNYASGFGQYDQEVSGYTWLDYDKLNGTFVSNAYRIRKEHSNSVHSADVYFVLK